MALTTYTAGEVLTAASLNNNFTFAAANPTGGLTLISSTTIGSAVSSVTISSAFGATYDAYKIVVSGGAGSLANGNMQLTLGASGTGYYSSVSGLVYATAAAISYAISNSASWTRIGSATTNGINIVLDINNPFLAKYTYISGSVAYTDEGGSLNGVHEVATSYTAFTINPSSGTLTGGTVRVYGYLNS
jgi:hypothetical protein